MTKVNGPVFSHAKLMLSRPSSTLPVLGGGCQWFLVWGSRLDNVGSKFEKYCPCCELVAQYNICKESSSVLTRLSSALELASRPWLGFWFNQLVLRRTLHRCFRKKFSLFAATAACSSQQLKSRRKSLESSGLLVRALVGAQDRLWRPQERTSGEVPESQKRQEGEGPPERSLEIRE